MYVVEFPSFSLEMSSVYDTAAISTIRVVLQCKFFLLYVCFVLLLYEIASRLNHIVVNYWLYLLETSQSLP